MQSLAIQSFADLLHGHDSAQILNYYDRQVVRDIAVVNDNVRIASGPDNLLVRLNTRIQYEPWFMDRGSLLFEHPEFKPYAKICTEYDIVRYPDGSEYRIIPHPDADVVK